jgi:hypothetical protein
MVLFVSQSAWRGTGQADPPPFLSIECGGDQRNVINETNSEAAFLMKGGDSAVAPAGAADVGGSAARPDGICPPRSGTFPRHYAEAA